MVQEKRKIGIDAVQSRIKATVGYREPKALSTVHIQSKFDARYPLMRKLEYIVNIACL